MGASLAPLFAPGNEPLPQRVQAVYRQFLATNFPKRAKAIARQIALKKPDLIGIQEAAIIELIPINAPEKKVVYDFIDILLHALRSIGLNYTVAVERIDPEPVVLPDASGNYISYRDREVILVRTKSNVKIINTLEGNFKAALPITIGGQTIPIIRGWAAVDACICGQMFRMVTTHLEPLSPQVNEAQGNELLVGPGNTLLPLIFSGDFNSDANSSSPKTYGNMIAAGFKDTWLIAGQGDGFTDVQDPDLLNAESHLSRRIDFVFIRDMNDWKVIKDDLVGEEQADRTPSRLWPSDHAGIASLLELVKRQTC